MAFVTVVLLSERRKFGRICRPERRDGLGACGADCVARGSGGGSCGGGKLTRLGVQCESFLAICKKPIHGFM